MTRTLSQNILTLAQPRLRLRAPGARGDQPVFVIGSGRSGNTLVRRLLMASGQIYIPPETYVLGDIIEGWPKGVLLPWQQRVWLFCAHFEKHRHFQTFGLSDLNAFASQAAALPRAQQSLRNLIDAFFLYLASEQQSDVTRWGEKSPWNTFHLPAIGACFPSASYVFLVRDGRDVALSYVEAGLYPDLASAAQRWTVANTACLKFSRWSRSFRQLRYEDLVRDPDTEVAALFSWLDLPFESAMLTRDVGKMGDVESLSHHKNVSQPISPQSAGRWREHAVPGAFDALPSAFWQTMDALGYARS